MSTQIGSASVTIAANADRLTAGLDKAAKDVTDWAKITEQKAAAKSGGGAGGGLIGTILMGAKGGPAGVLAAAGGALIGGGAAGLFDAFDRLKDLGKVGKQADALGIASDQFMGLSAAMGKVGVEGDAVGATFAKLGNRIQQAAGGGAAAGAFKQIGIDAASLAGMPLDQQFLAVADAISKIPPGGQQAAAVMAAFGDEGLKLLPVLQKGAGGLQEFIDKQKAMGLALDPKQMAAAQRAAAAFPKIGQAIEGVKNRVAVALAPAIAAVGNLIAKAFEKVAPILDWVARLAEAYYFVWGELIGEVADGIGTLIDVIAGWVKETLGLGEVTVTIQDVVFGFFKGAAMAAGYLWDTLKAGVGAMSYATSFVVDGLAIVVDAFKETIRGLLELAGELPDALGGAGFRAAARDVDKWAGRLERTAEKMRAWGKNTFATWGGSAKAAGAYIDGLQKKFNAAGEAAGKAGAVAAAGGIVGAPKLGGAFEMGSEKAYSVLANWRAGQITGGKGDPQTQMVDQQKLTNRKLDKTVDAIQKRPTLGVI